ncbi:hypothetical protein CGH62_20635, partial [Vibrio parahaemolyticus]
QSGFQRNNLRLRHIDRKYFVMSNKIYCIGLAVAKFACLDMPLNTFQTPVSLKYKDDELSTNRI